MDKELLEWLRFRFYRDNHVKYRKYFDEWVENVTEDQLVGFKKCMFYDKERVLAVTVKQDKQ